MEPATHTPFVPQGVPAVSKPFDLNAQHVAKSDFTSILKRRFETYPNRLDIRPSACKAG